MNRALLVAVALGAAFPAITSPAPTVKSIELHRDDGDGKPGETVKSFLTTDHRIHLRVDTVSLKLGQTVAKWKVVGADTEAGKDIPVGDLETSGLIANQFDATFRLPRDWPAGKYRASLFVDGELLTTIDYEMRRPLSALKIKETRLRRDDGKGEPGEIVKAFHPADRRLHFEVVTGGIGPGFAFTWIYKAVDTSGGQNVHIGTVGPTPFDGDMTASILTSHVELPRDWPTGRYEVLLLANDTLLTRIPFTVEPSR